MQTCVTNVCINCVAMCAYGCRYIAMCMYCYATYGYDKIHMWIANGHTHMSVMMLACGSVHMCNIAWSHKHMHSRIRNKMQCPVGEGHFRNAISHCQKCFFFKLLENVWLNCSVKEELLKSVWLLLTRAEHLKLAVWFLSTVVKNWLNRTVRLRHCPR